MQKNCLIESYKNYSLDPLFPLSNSSSTALSLYTCTHYIICSIGIQYYQVQYITAYVTTYRCGCCYNIILTKYTNCQYSAHKKRTIVSAVGIYVIVANNKTLTEFVRNLHAVFNVYLRREYLPLIEIPCKRRGVLSYLRQILRRCPIQIINLLFTLGLGNDAYFVLISTSINSRNTPVKNARCHVPTQCL